jgi:hypothetical protein
MEVELNGNILTCSYNYNHLQGKKQQATEPSHGNSQQKQTSSSGEVPSEASPPPLTYTHSQDETFLYHIFPNKSGYDTFSKDQSMPHLNGPRTHIKISTTPGLPPATKYAYI